MSHSSSDVERFLTLNFDDHRLISEIQSLGRTVSPLSAITIVNAIDSSIEIPTPVHRRVISEIFNNENQSDKFSAKRSRSGTRSCRQTSQIIEVPEYLARCLRFIQTALKPSKAYLLPSHLSLITSTEMTEVQSIHIDYPSLLWTERKPEYLPLSLIVALEDHVHLLVESEDLPIPKGSGFLFKGNLGHQGVGGLCGARMHVFFGTRFNPADPSSNGFYDLNCARLGYQVPLTSRFPPHLPCSTLACRGLPPASSILNINITIQCLRYMEPLVRVLKGFSSQPNQKHSKNLCSILSGIFSILNDQSVLSLTQNEYHNILVQVLSDNETMSRILRAVDLNGDHLLHHESSYDIIDSELEMWNEFRDRDVHEIFLSIIARCQMIAAWAFSDITIQEFGQLVEIILEKNLSCETCLTNSNYEHRCNDFIFTIPAQAKEVDLVDLLKNYFKESKIENTSSSQGCCANQKSSQRIIQLPEVLVIKFKRSPGQSTPTTYPMTLDLRDFLTETSSHLVQTEYWLSGVVLQTNGHSTCYLRNRDESTAQWAYYRNDKQSKISRRQFENQKTLSRPYLLLYRREIMSEKMIRRSLDRLGT